MTSHSNITIAPHDIAPLLGDPHPLLAQLGASEDLTVPASASQALQLRGVRSLPALRSFLQAYQAKILVPLELPVILRAHAHASRHEVRELIALDQQLATQPKLREFAVASCRVGQRQLSRLRPLRDYRVVRRYLAAIEAGEARGWHTLVYGVSLAAFSLPLQQGLLSYAQHTLGGFIESAAGPLALTTNQCDELQAQVGEGTTGAVRAMLQPGGKPMLRLV